MRFGNQRGNVAVMFAVSALALTGLTGGAVTMARLNTAGTRLQDAADGAALAAAAAAQGSAATEVQVRDAAERWAASALRNDPHKDGPATTAVSLAGREPTRVTVAMEQAVETMFAGALGVERMTVRRQATAVGGPQRRACLLVLEPSAPHALELQGSPKLTGELCVAHVNSAAPGAMSLLGSAEGEMEAAYVSGPRGPVHGFKPAPQFSQPPLADPVAGRIRWPGPGPCRPAPAAGADRLSPGTYCGGLEIPAGAELLPGLYVVASGDLVVNGRGAHGEGVTIVLLDPAGVIELKGNNSLRLTAPTSGEWEGIAIAAKPGPVMTTSRIFGMLELDGILYLPGQKLHLQGNAGSTGVTGSGTRVLVVRRLEARGTPTLELAGGFPSYARGPVRLLE